MGVAVVFAAVVMGYPVLSETLMRGRTVGKRALGLRAVTLEGAPIRLRHALLRMMGGLVDRYLPPLGVTGMLFVVGTARHQRVGDLISGTIVIRDPERTCLPPAVWFPVPPGLEGFAATIDPTAMTDEQYTVIRSFLMRNRELSADARFSLATDLAGRVAALRHDGVQRCTPESYLLCVISRYQRRNFPTTSRSPGNLVLGGPLAGSPPAEPSLLVQRATRLRVRSLCACPATPTSTMRPPRPCTRSRSRR
ncbi:MAG: RDD family protein [Acidimicrobiaceae bacterium]|nr:RDD family protein [Acidimicrobiaceae bacterium]